MRSPAQIRASTTFAIFSTVRPDTPAKLATRSHRLVDEQIFAGPRVVTLCALKHRGADRRGSIVLCSQECPVSSTLCRFQLTHGMGELPLEVAADHTVLAAAEPLRDSGRANRVDLGGSSGRLNVGPARKASTAS